MSKPQNVMLVSIALTAATVCTTRACTKRLDETQWPEARDETYWAETETYCSETRPRRDVNTSRDRDVSTETTSLALDSQAYNPYSWLAGLIHGLVLLTAYHG